MSVPRKLSFSTISTSFLLSIIAFPVSLISFAFLYTHKDSFWSALWIVAALPAIWVSVTVLTPRSWMNQLFTFRPLDFRIPPNGLAFVQKFSVCAPGRACKASTTGTETKTFRPNRAPDGCCTLEVVNGSGKKYKAEVVHVFLNGEEVNLPSNACVQIAPTSLSRENKVTVQLTGTRDAFVYVVISYTGKKEEPATPHPSAPG
jgi:hypothetical protein